MRRGIAMMIVALGVWPAAAIASDLAEALNFAADVMGEDITDGYEDFMDYDETEALGVLLARDVVPGRPPNEYLAEEAMASNPKSPYFTTLGPSRASYAALRVFIDEAASMTGLPAALIDAVIRTESGYRTEAVSRVGARGLMQLMPATAAELGVDDPFDPRQNIIGGATYLRKLYDQFGSIRLAVAAYNAGPGKVRKHGGIPPFKETRRYVKTVLRRYKTSPIGVR